MRENGRGKVKGKCCTQKEKRIVRHQSAEILETNYLRKLPKNYLRKLPTQEQSKSSTEGSNANDPTKKVNENEEHLEIRLSVTRLQRIQTNEPHVAAKLVGFPPFQTVALPSSGYALTWR